MLPDRSQQSCFLSSQKTGGGLGPRFQPFGGDNMSVEDLHTMNTGKPTQDAEPDPGTLRTFR